MCLNQNYTSLLNDTMLGNQTMMNQTLMNQTMVLGEGLAVGKTRNGGAFGDDFKSVNKVQNQFKITELYTNALAVKMIGEGVVEVE